MSEARRLAAALVSEGQRMASICNACRYCEGYCAVFPAIERRLSFDEHDLAYLANLCHNCGSCYYACQYAPPHEFQLNLPKLLADIRIETYQKYAWPDAFARLFQRNGLVASLGLAGSLVALLFGLGAMGSASMLFSAHPDEAGSFYAVISHRAMVWAFGIVFLFVLVALFVGAVRFWRDTQERLRDMGNPASLSRAMGDVLQLRYLDGGGEGCTYPDERPSHLRRWFHHLTFYGFLLCFAATCVATFYHYVLRSPAPYPFWSWPVGLGTLGGIGLLLGPAGLLWLKHRRDPALGATTDGGMDNAFLALLWSTSASGLALLAWRQTQGMPLLLVVHLALVMALFLTLPYGKFVHAVYRFAALLRYHLERKRPLPDLGAE
jgi:citrate/tricarballylate utilization protein